MRLHEKFFEWQRGAWIFGITPDGDPYNFTITLPLMHLRCERDVGSYW